MTATIPAVPARRPDQPVIREKSWLRSITTEINDPETSTLLTRNAFSLKRDA
jgi:hypothetical protein